jgi:diguanylate cyclase (GGDEF)-like protein
MSLTTLYAGVAECYHPEVFRHLLQQEVKRARRYSEFFSLLVLSPDDAAAEAWASADWRVERLLGLMVENIRQELRDTDYIGRCDNHLAVVLLHSSVEETRLVAKRVRQRIGWFSFPPELTSGSARVTVSMGAACFPTDGRDLSSLLRCALLSLDRAREGGGNRAVMFQDRGDGA